MSKIYLKFNKKMFGETIKFLNGSSIERTAFLLVDQKQSEKEIIFTVREIYFVKNNKRKYSVELEDKIISDVIKFAWDKNLSLAEIHSHPFSKKNATFSYFDISEFEKFVPYVFWRLKNRPYIALVFGKKDFDAQVWLDNPKVAVKLDAIIVGKNIFNSTNICFDGENYDR